MLEVSIFLLFTYIQLSYYLLKLRFTESSMNILVDVLRKLDILNHCHTVADRPHGELFTLASTLGKSCKCGKVNDMSSLFVPLERKSNTASTNFNLTLQ